MSENMGEKHISRHSSQWKRWKRWLRHLVRHIHHLQFKEVSGADIQPAVHGESHIRTARCLKGTMRRQPCSRDPTGPLETETIDEAGLLAGLLTLWRTDTRVVWFWRTTPHGKTRDRADYEEIQSVGRIHAGEVHEGLTILGRIPRWIRGRMEGERSSRSNVWSTDHNPHSPSLCGLGRR